MTWAFEGHFLNVQGLKPGLRVAGPERVKNGYEQWVTPHFLLAAPRW